MLGRCRLLRLALHRHSELLSSTGVHQHRYHQILVYLRGGGKVRTGSEVHEVLAGTVLLLPAGCEHQFIRHSRRNPLCLSIDFLCGEAFAFSLQRPGMFRLSMLRKLMNELAHFKECTALADQLQRDGLAAQLLGVCLDVVLQTSAGASRHPVNFLLQMESLIEQTFGSKLTLSDAARRSGYQKDYLNRILKEQSGMTFGQLRAQLRLRHAQAALKNHGSVAAAAQATGFDDVNYFTRWFRKQTGYTPGKVLRGAV